MSPPVALVTGASSGIGALIVGAPPPHRHVGTLAAAHQMGAARAGIRGVHARWLGALQGELGAGQARSVPFALATQVIYRSTSMDKTDVPLTPTAASLLGFLHHGPATGWDLCAKVELTIGDFWNVTK